MPKPGLIGDRKRGVVNQSRRERPVLLPLSCVCGGVGQRAAAAVTFRGQAWNMGAGWDWGL